MTERAHVVHAEPPVAAKFLGFLLHAESSVWGTTILIRPAYDRRMEIPSFHDAPERAARTFAAWVASWWRVFHFGAKALVMAASPSAYDRATSNLMARQIYFTAWQILPGFLLVCAILSYMVIRIVIMAAVSYGLEDYALDLVVRVLMLELIPMFVALFVA